MDNEKLKKLVGKVFKKGYSMSLATMDEEGVWAADVIYVYDDDLNIYWISDPAARHSQAIIKNSRVVNEKLFGFEKQKLSF